MKLYQNITVDLFKPYPLPVMNVQQNNQGHVAIVTLTAGGTILDPADETLTAWAKKKDGTVSYIECEYDAGKVKVELTNQMLALDGQLQVELQMVSESCNITTPIFIVCVGKSNISDKAIKSQNEFTVLQNKIKEVRTLSEYMTTLTGGQVASASLASEMTDTEMIYLYVGTEKGYINGSWYYYDSKNAAWISSITNGDVSRYFNSVSTDTLTWNGITTGLVTDDGGIWYKVSDDMPTIEDADTGVINWIAYNGTENERSFRGAYVSGDDLSAMAYRTYNTDETVYVIADLDNFYVAVVTQDGGTYNNRTFPETGTYFWGATLTVSSFTIDGFNGFTTEQLRYECTPPKVIDKLNQLSYEVELANENVSNLSEEIGNQKGLTDEAKTALLNCFKNVAWIVSNGQDYYNALETALNASGSSGDDSGSGDSGSEGTEVTLSSISATYTGGNVAVGTALTDLTGITVKATYSDGSTANVTDYTLSGTIAEGSNAITVAYGGKTTTFTVTGVAESSGGDSGEPIDAYSTYQWTDGVYINWNTTTNVAAETTNDTMTSSEYISLDDVTKIEAAEVSGKNLAQYNVIFYDESKAGVSSSSGYVRMDNATYPSPAEIAIPENASYVRFCGKIEVLNNTASNSAYLKYYIYKG